MAVSYTLELFPTAGNMEKYQVWFDGDKSMTKTGENTYFRSNENAGVDLYCVKDQKVEAYSVTLLDLGVKARLLKIPVDTPNPCHFWLAPRSSIWKSDVRQANSIGVIDRSYRGVLMGAVIPNHAAVAGVKEGARLFQVIAPDMGWISHVVLRPESEIDATNRGEGGFGSTGR
jgi:dUTP pyrophosphatase